MNKKIKNIFIMTLLITVVLMPLVSSVDQLQDDEFISQNDGGKWYYTTVYSDIAQSFTPTEKKILTRVRLPLKNQYVTGDVTVSIRTDLNGDDLTSYARDGSSIDFDGDFYDFDFPDITIYAGTTYYIVLHVGGNSDIEAIGWEYSTDNPYIDGSAWYEWIAPEWYQVEQGGCDFRFSVWGTNSKKRSIEKDSQIDYQLSPGVIDQEQAITSDDQFLTNGVPHWQEFVNRGNILEEVEVHIGHYYSGSKPMTLSIEEVFGGTPLTSKTLTTADIPDHVLDWCTFDVPDVQLTKGQKYYIVIRFDPGSEYAWSGANSNPYPDGISSVGPNWDFAFRTYVDRSKSDITVNNLFINILNKFFEEHFSFFPALKLIIGLI